MKKNECSEGLNGDQLMHLGRLRSTCMQETEAYIKHVA